MKTQSIPKRATIKPPTVLALAAAFSLFCCPLNGAAASQVALWFNSYAPYPPSNLPADLTNVVSIAAGATYGLALRNNGTITAWGQNYHGQTNVPAGLSNVVAIAAARMTYENFGGASLALKADGTVIAWGDNYYHQTNVPAGLSNVVAISVGISHSLALRNDGTVVGWGPNYSIIQMPPAGLTNVVTISAGGMHSLALKSDGTVVAWGSDFNGELRVPAGLSNVVAVAAGRYHSLALRSDGKVVAWGGNYSGETNIPTGLSNVVAISSSAENLALRSDGKVVAWGNAPPSRPGPIPGLSNIVAVSAADSYGMVLTGDFAPSFTTSPVDLSFNYGVTASVFIGTVGTAPLSYQWRFNGTEIPGATNAVLLLPNIQIGQSGSYSLVVSNAFGAAISSNVTVRVIPLAVTGQPRSQSPFGGATVSFSVTAIGEPPLNYQWQSNGTNLPGATDAMLTFPAVRFDQAGVYTVVVSNAYGRVRSTDAILSVSDVAAWGYNSVGQINLPLYLTNIVAIAAGANHSLALRADGFVRAWGDNSCHQLDVPTSLTNAIAVAAGGCHSVALRSDGTVLCWGDNSHGQTADPVGLTNVVAIAAGDYHSLALRANGSVIGWGDNVHGQTSVPAAASNAVGIAAGGSHSAVVLRDGSVVAWGTDIFGDKLSYMPASASNVVAIACGRYHMLALRADGEVIAWGLQTSVPSNVTDIVEIAAGGTHNLALESDGSLLAWGGGGSELEQSKVPAGLRSVVAIACGGTHNLALVGHGPFAYPQSITVNEDTPIQFVLHASDVDRPILTYSIVDPPTHGTILGTPPDVTYLAFTNYNGPDSFTFKVNDGQSESKTVAVSILVNPVNDAPVAMAKVSPLFALHPTQTNLLVIAPDGTNATVVLDGTQSWDLENDPLKFSWLDDGTNLLSQGAVVTNALGLGPHFVDLYVSDHQETSKSPLVFEVITPARAVMELALLVDASNLGHRNKQPLLETLSAAMASFERRNTESALNQLTAFQSKVRAQIAPFDAGLATTLATAAEEIIDAERAP